MRSAVDKAVSNRERYVDKFCSHLNKDINELSQEVKDVKNDAQVTNIKIGVVTKLAPPMPFNSNMLGR